MKYFWTRNQIECSTRGIKQGGFRNLSLEWRFELEDAFQTEFLCSNLQNSSILLHLIKIVVEKSHADGVDSLPSKTKNSRKFFIWTRFYSFFVIYRPTRQLPGMFFTRLKGLKYRSVKLRNFSILECFNLRKPWHHRWLHGTSSDWQQSTT